MSKYKIGDTITCMVTGVEQYGIFVELEDGYKGLIHISEVSDKFVRNIFDYAGIDNKIYAKVIDVDEKNKKVSLSLKKLDRDDYIISRRKIVETKNGFNPLKEHLDKWIKEKLDEIE